MPAVERHAAARARMADHSLRRDGAYTAGSSAAAHEVLSAVAMTNERELCPFMR